MARKPAVKGYSGNAAVSQAADKLLGWWNPSTERTEALITSAQNAISDTVGKAENALWGFSDYAVETIFPNVASSAAAALAQLSYSGATGNFQSAMENITLFAKFQKIAEQYPERIGRPYCRKVRLNTLSGFISCQAPSFHSVIATTDEEALVESFMSGGFYYE